MSKKSTFSLFNLVMLITVSIDSIRNLPLAASFGPTLIFFFFVAAILFLIPTGLISAELTASHTKHSGIYGWIKKAFGSHMGFLSIWLQWVNTLVWYPTTLAFIAGSFWYTVIPKFNPALAKNHILIAGTVAALFWLLTVANLRGFKASARFASWLAVFGMLIPMALILVLTGMWLIEKPELQLHITSHTIIPPLNIPSSWVSMMAIVTSFLGMELASVHANQIKHPAKTLPRAIVFSAILILITMLLGSLAIAIALPHQKISLVTGIMQEFQFLLSHFHIKWLSPILVVLIILGGLASTINWIISPAEGLLQASEDHYLPIFFKHRNANGVASRILITQAILVSLTSTYFVLIPQLSGAYWLLTALSTELYVSMYLLMFIAAIWLFIKTGLVSKMLQRIGGKWALFSLSIAGIIGCCITLIVGFIPPPKSTHIEIGSSLNYHIKFICGLLIMLLPVLFGFFHQRQHRKRPLN